MRLSLFLLLVVISYGCEEQVRQEPHLQDILDALNARAIFIPKDYSAFKKFDGYYMEVVVHNYSGRESNYLIDSYKVSSPILVILQDVDGEGREYKYSIKHGNTIQSSVINTVPDDKFGVAAAAVVPAEPIMRESTAICLFRALATNEGSPRLDFLQKEIFSFGIRFQPRPNGANNKTATGLGQLIAPPVNPVKGQK